MMALGNQTQRPGAFPTQDDFADELLELRQMLAAIHLDVHDSPQALETARTRLNAVTLRTNRMLQALEPRLRNDGASGVLLEIRFGTGEAQRSLFEPAKEARDLPRLERARGALHRALFLLAQACATRCLSPRSIPHGTTDTLVPMRMVLAAMGQAGKSEAAWFVSVTRAEIGLLLASSHGRLPHVLLVQLVELDAHLGGNAKGVRERVVAFFTAMSSSAEPTPTPRL